MQYLYDDIIPPFRFFTKIVMRCVNDALDATNKPHYQEQGLEEASCGSSNITNDNSGLSCNTTIDSPPVIAIPAGVVLRSTISSQPSESASVRRSSAGRKVLTAFCFEHSVILSGFADGRVTMAYISQREEGLLEHIEIPSFAPNVGHVTSLSCAPYSGTQWAVTVGYSKAVYLTMVTAKSGSYYSVPPRKRMQQRIVEINTTEWAAGGHVSSLQLSPSLAHLAMGFNDDALVIIAKLPSLEVQRGAQSDTPERSTLGLSHRVVEDGSLTRGRHGRVFFIPESPQWRLQAAFSSSTGSGTTESMYGQHSPLCLLVWTESNNYARCPLNNISSSALEWLHAAPRTESPSADSMGKKQATAVAAAAALAAQRVRTKSDAGASKRKTMDAAQTVVATPAKLTPFKGVYRGVLPDRIVTASVASANGSVVAVGCNGGLVYLLDGHGITSVVSVMPVPARDPLHLTTLYPVTGAPRSATLHAVTAVLGAGERVMLVHARSTSGAALTECAKVSCLQDVVGLRAVLALGELPLALVFCDHGVYLWDVHYNCVVTSLTGLPPLEPFALYELATRETGSGAPRLNGTMKHQCDAYLPSCTDVAVFWRTKDGAVARLLLQDLLQCVYPLLGTYFPGLPLCSLARILECVPPAHRYVAERLAAAEVPTMRQLGGSDDLLAGMAASMSTTGASLRSGRVSKALQHPGAAAASFLEAACSTVGVRTSEMSRIFEPH